MKILKEKRTELMERLRETMRQANIWKSKIEQFDFLWLENRNEHLENFLHPATPFEQFDSESSPTLQQFQSQINFFQSIYNEVDAWNSSFIFNSWLKVDARPIKRQLLNLLTEWIDL